MQFFCMVTTFEKNTKSGLKQVLDENKEPTLQNKCKKNRNKKTNDLMYKTPNENQIRDTVYFITNEGPTRGI